MVMKSVAFPDLKTKIINTNCLVTTWQHILKICRFKLGDVYIVYYVYVVSGCHGYK